MVIDLDTFEESFYGATDAFQTFATDEEFSDGVNFSTMPGATVLYVR